MSVTNQVRGSDLLLAPFQPADVMVAHDVVTRTLQLRENVAVMLQTIQLSVVHRLGGLPLGNLNPKVTWVDGEVGLKLLHLVDKPLEFFCPAGRACVRLAGGDRHSGRSGAVVVSWPH